MVKTLRLGSDFTGLAVGAIACKQVSNKLGYKFVHTHSCDKSRASQKFVEYVCKAEVMQKNIMHRDLEACGPCDVYVWTAPCTPFSSFGRREGVDAAQGSLAAFSLQYIKRWKPRTILSENVATLLTYARYKALGDFIKREIEKAGYVVKIRLLNSKDFLLPHWRNRWYLVAIRSDSLRTNMSVSWWPKPLSPPLDFKHLINILPPDKWKSLPTFPLWKANCIAAYEKCVTDGVNPFETCVIVDIGASRDYSQHRVNMCPTLTRTRCCSRGYWCSLKGGRLSTAEMASLQGLSERLFPWKDAGLDESAFLGAVGDCMSMTVIESILPRLLYMGKLISKEEYSMLQS